MTSYRALAFRGSEGATQVILFAAAAVDVEEWSGVPQREIFDDGQETIGFQREENDRRLSQLATFFSNPHNVAQNTLLCARRDASAVWFQADEGVNETELVQSGHLIVEAPELHGLPLSRLFALLEQQLEQRQPALAQATPDPLRQRRLLERLREQVDTPTGAEDEVGPDPDSISEEEGVSGLFMSETHVLEFWQELRIRRDLLENLPEANRSALESAEAFLGFDRDALVAYLKPVFLVDGQHRLRGALLSADEKARNLLTTDEVQARIDAGEDLAALTSELKRATCRLLPISLLLDESVEEHVFQFVVVNQKATPVGKALLGTIVATSLTEEELGNVSDRLEQVQINVSDSQAVAWFTRNSQSAFYGLVQQGLDNEGKKKLMWSVLRDLVSIFRNLSGGKLYDRPRNDYADMWRRRLLTESASVSAAIAELPEDEKLTAALEEWQKLDGPWRGIANAFFCTVRDTLGDPTNSAAHNGWGGISNLYNKVSLTILVADFFQWLTDNRKTIDSSDQCADLVREWLSEVDKAYFNRDWSLSGVKRESTGIRNQWSELWVDYRKDPRQLPDYRNYRKVKMA